MNIEMYEKAYSSIVVVTCHSDNEMEYEKNVKEWAKQKEQVAKAVEK